MHWITCVEGGPRRVNHAASAVDGQIFTFGGYCMSEDPKINTPIDVHVLNTKTLKWTKIGGFNGSNHNDVPFKRYGHTAVTYKDKIYIWGGRNDEEACNTLFCFNPETFRWSRPQVTGVVPGARDGHSSCMAGKYMYIFGGFEAMLDSLSNFVYALDLDIMHWSIIRTSGTPPKARDFHTAITLNNRMYVFGGRSDNPSSLTLEEEWYCNDMFYLDLKTNAWVCLSNIENKPIGRRSHSVFSHMNKMYIFGGFNGYLGQHYNDLYEFDVDKNKWTYISPYGTPPCKRRRQVCILIDKRLYLFGGTSPSLFEQKLPDYAELIADYLDVMLTDHSDLHILDFNPTLKTLCFLAIKQYRLEKKELPKSLQEEYKHLSFSVMPHRF